MELSGVVAAVRSAMPRVLVAVDFDGTLAPLVDEPELSAPAPGAIAALAGLAGRGARVAVITGRDARTAVRLGGFDTIDGVVVEGLYGAESWQGGNLSTSEAPPALDRLRGALPSALEGADSRVWLEDKRLSLVVHARLAPDSAAELAALRPALESLAADAGMDVYPGHDVLELRLPGPDKGAALRRLTEPGVLTLYLGDDLGDLPAFTEIGRLRAEGETAYGIGVRSSGVVAVAEAADVMVDSPADVVGLLEALLKA